MRYSIIPTLVVTIAAHFSHAAEPPNIILIVADDLGYGDLACYGGKVSQTPNIDQLAAEGLRFTDFHSNGSMCTPTRAAMLTGQYQQRFGRKFDGPLSGATTRDHGLPLAAVTIAEVLNEQGYATGAFGKWHLGYIPPWLPTSQGFDEFRGLGAGDGDHHTHIDRWGREDWWHNDKLDMEEGYTAELLTKHSVDFIEAHQHEPFFLYLPHLAIHFPWQGPNDPPHREKGKEYGDDKWGIIPNPKNVSPHVKAMVESIDKSVAQIMQTLTQLGLEEKSLVVFTSDNGGYLNYGETFHNISSNGPLRGQKGTLYEGGHRVPMIFYWPKRIDPGVTDATALSIDLFPTFANLAGVAPEQLELDGVDLAGLLFDGQPLADRTLFWRDHTDRAVRQGPWKLCASGDQTELFNLDEDLGEGHDLAEQKPRLVANLLDAWQAWDDDVNKTASTYAQQAH